MYTCAPSEVIHGRSLPARSMICAVQLLRLKPGKVAPGHVIAETEIRARRNGLLIGTTSVVAWSAPVEPTSTSASPPPNTTAKPSLSQCAVYRALQGRRRAEIAGPQLRAEAEKSSQRRYRHKIAIEGDLRLATAVRQQQGCVGKTRIPRAPGLQRPTSLSV